MANSRQRSTVSAIRLRCGESVTAMVSSASEYHLSQVLLRDRDDLLFFHDRLARAALELIDEADLTCHRKNEEIPVGECPCAVCVLKGLAASGGAES